MNSRQEKYTGYSVLMSVYEKELVPYLDLSIDSMLNQTLKPDQIVLVKDGLLTKDLDARIASYKLQYPDLFTIVALPENKGLGIALDEGLKFCRNELVARMDSDDISLPDRCEMQVMEFNKDSALSIVGTMIDEFYDNPHNIVSSRRVPIYHSEIKKFIRRRSPFNHPTVMFKKSDVIRSGGYGKLRRKQDLDLFSRMINNGCKGLNIDKSLLLFRSNEANFKRRKSWSYCKSYVVVGFEIWKRRHCSLLDLIFIVIAQMVMFLSPMWLLKWISHKYLRTKYS